MRPHEFHNYTGTYGRGGILNRELALINDAANRIDKDSGVALIEALYLDVSRLRDLQADRNFTPLPTDPAKWSIEPVSIVYDERLNSYSLLYHPLINGGPISGWPNGVNHLLRRNGSRADPGGWAPKGENIIVDIYAAGDGEYVLYSENEELGVGDSLYFTVVGNTPSNLRKNP